MTRPNAINLDRGFDSFTAHWTPHVAGDVGDMQVKLAKFSGSFDWHSHADEDEMFLVHKGKMLMKFRTHEVTVNAGEFIVVPRGIEHCPVAVSDECEVVLFEPKTTLNTGATVSDLTVENLPTLSSQGGAE